MEDSSDAIRDALWSVRSLFLEAESVWDAFRPANREHFHAIWLRQRNKLCDVAGSLEDEAAGFLTDDVDHWLILGNICIASQFGDSPIVELYGSSSSYHRAAFYFASGFATAVIHLVRPTLFDGPVYVAPKSLPDDGIDGKFDGVAEIVDKFRRFEEQKAIVARLEIEAAQAMHLCQRWQAKPREPGLPTVDALSIAEPVAGPVVAARQERFRPPKCHQCGAKVSVTSTTAVKRYLKCPACEWTGRVSRHAQNPS